MYPHHVTKAYWDRVGSAQSGGTIKIDGVTVSLRIRNGNFKKLSSKVQMCQEGVTQLSHYKVKHSLEGSWVPFAGARDILMTPSMGPVGSLGDTLYLCSRSGSCVSIPEQWMILAKTQG